MKKILIILSSVVLLFSLLIVPASAAGVIDAHIGVVEGHYAYFTDINAGYYSLNVYTDSSRAEMLLNVPSFELHDGTYTLYFDELSSIFTNITLSVVYSENVLQCALSGYSDHTGDSKFDLFGSVRYPNAVAELIPIAEPLTFVDGVLAVFSGIGSWFISSLLSVSVLFWNPDIMQLTLFGVMSIVAVGVALILLLIYHISQRMRFKT